MVIKRGRFGSYFVCLEIFVLFFCKVEFYIYFKEKYKIELVLNWVIWRKYLSEVIFVLGICFDLRYLVVCICLRVYKGKFYCSKFYYNYRLFFIFYKKVIVLVGDLFIFNNIWYKLIL